MSDNRTFKSPMIGKSLQAAIDTYWQQNREAHARIAKRRRITPFTHGIPTTVLTIFSMILLGDCLINGVSPLGVFGWDPAISFILSPLVLAAATVVAGGAWSCLQVHGVLEELPRHTQEHRKYFWNLIECIGAWEEFMKVVRRGETVKDLGEMGEFAWSYYEKLSGLTERWEAHLATVGDAEIRVMTIHREIGGTITDDEICELKKITKTLTERGRTEIPKQLTETIDAAAEVYELDKVREKTKVKQA